jgi:transcriptional regulator with XRE-family HTH domain
MDDKRYDEEVHRIAQVLSTVLPVVRRTRQSVEQELGLSSGYLSKILGGTVDLRVRHILAISEAAGMDPANFFALAYPRRGLQDSETRRVIANVQAALGQQPTALFESSAEFDEAVRQALACILGFRIDEPEPKQP